MHLKANIDKKLQKAPDNVQISSISNSNSDGWRLSCNASD